MGRPPPAAACCEKIDGKKGPWTPEEDIILASYIQQHGPGNWRLVPTNTGLLRCSKSCRLRWTNYLRPGIKRGNFTDHEENMIIHLQALVGNRWAAIASYLPHRTDNDIKNYWNTHLKKKLNKPQGNDEHSQDGGKSGSEPQISKGQWERKLQTNIHMAKQALCDALSLDKSNTSTLPDSKPFNYGYIPHIEPTQSSTYASSTENIAKLLENWTKNSPKSSQSNSENTLSSFNNPVGTSTSSPSEETLRATPDRFESLLSFNSSNCDVTQSINYLTPEISLFQDEKKPRLDSQMPLTLLEKWLLDDSTVQGQGDLMDMSLGVTTTDGLF